MSPEDAFASQLPPVEAVLQLVQIESILEQAGLREGHPTLADAVRTVVDVAVGRDTVDARMVSARLRHPAGQGRAAKI